MPDQPVPHPGIAMAPARRNRRRTLVALAGIVVLLAAGFTLWRMATRPDPIHIAFANSMSGPLEPVGAEILKAATMYIDEVNHHGGVDGHPVMLDIFDDRGSTDVARTNVQAIVDSPAVAVLGHFLSAASLAASPGYRAARIPALTTQALADDLTIGNPYYFRAQTPNSEQGRWLAHYIREVLLERSGRFPGHTDVDLVTSSDQFGQSFARGFAPAMGEQIPRTWTFNPRFEDHHRRRPGRRRTTRAAIRTAHDRRWLLDRRVA